MPIKVLLVEDDDALCELFRYNLEAEKFKVDVCQDGDDVMDTIEALQPDIVLMDWMLPNVSGLELCRQIRSYKKTKTLPVILLTSKSEAVDKIHALNTGADDYIVKPPNSKEMAARIRAVIRRYNAQENDGGYLVFEDIRLDRNNRRVYKGEQTVHLGPTEFKLLECLMERPGRVLSREQLLDIIWNHDTDVELRTVDVHIGRLRKALSNTECPKSQGKQIIRTIRAAGYALSKD